MPTTIDPPSNHHSSRGGGGGGGGVGGCDGDTDQGFRYKLRSPWAQVVRGQPPASPDQLRPSDLAPASAASGDFSGPEAESCGASKGNAGSPPAQVKQKAWKKPAKVDAVEVGPVMGDAVFWPALSESAKASYKSLNVESAPKFVSEGSVPDSPAPMNPNLPVKQGPYRNGSPKSAPNNMPPVRRRLNRRVDAGIGIGRPQSSFGRPPSPPPPAPPLPPQLPIFPMPPSPYGNYFPPPMQEFSNGQPFYAGNINWSNILVGGFPSNPQILTDGTDFSRKGNFRPHLGGDGTSRYGQGNRHDQDQGNHPDASDAHLWPLNRAPRGFVRPPRAPVLYFGPQHRRPFGAPNSFTENTPQYYSPGFYGDPYFGSPHMVHTPAAPIVMPLAVPKDTLGGVSPENDVPVAVPHKTLPLSLADQIEYYFSEDNLVKDENLRYKMDDEGWVPIEIIASFPLVKEKTENIEVILDSLRSSTVVEVKDKKVRRRGDGKRWKLKQPEPSSRRLN